MVVFDLDCNIHGAAAIVVRQPLMPRCLSDGEIDANIKSLKDELDAVALKMVVLNLIQPAQPGGRLGTRRGRHGRMKPAGGVRRERLGETRHNMPLYMGARAACATFAPLISAA